MQMTAKQLTVDPFLFSPGRFSTNLKLLQLPGQIFTAKQQSTPMPQERTHADVAICSGGVFCHAGMTLTEKQSVWISRSRHKILQK